MKPQSAKFFCPRCGKYQGNIARILNTEKRFIAHSCKHTDKRYCMSCGKEMTIQMDIKTGKLTPYSWRCECMPKGTVLMIE